MTPLRRNAGYALICIALLAGCSGAPERGSVAYQRELYQPCASCHGTHGEGEAALRPVAQGEVPHNMAPAIAGMSEWYVKAQLRKFQGEIRGAHVADVGGMRMKPMSLYLRTDEDLQLVADYVASLPVVPPATSAAIADADATRGRTLFAVCATCHGPDARGNFDKRAPSLVNANDWYLVSQLQKFKDGVRGAHPKDLAGSQMRPMAMTLIDDQARKDVVAYIMSMR